MLSTKMCGLLFLVFGTCHATSMESILARLDALESKNAQLEATNAQLRESLSTKTDAVTAFGPTFGNGLAGVSICGKSRPNSIIVNHTLAPNETHGVLHHFWATGEGGKIDRCR
jgi:hypothetical protein